MKVAIIGSRDYKNYGAICAQMDELLVFFDSDFTDVISGAARGVDSLGAVWAESRGINVIEKPANWKMGKGAGMARNTNIVSEADFIVAFWDGKSLGTKDSLKKCRQFGKRFKIVKVGLPWDS